MKKFWVVLFLLFFSCYAVFAEEEITTITILNARQTEYKKDEESGNDSILLEGSVQISVQKGNSISEINADKITYDRKTEMLFAEGNVEIITKSSSEGGEKSTASSLLMNTSTLEGVFNDGRVVQTQSDALNLPSGSTLIVFSDIFGKSESNTIAFKNSSLTFCDDENPHWHIDATRTWLLPGGEFAFFNALLYIGPIPVFYFPAFYYPKDELIFNPVFGFSNKKGYYFQTTTYFYGRKPLEETSSSSSTTGEAGSESLKSLYNFMKPSTLKKQERQGLVLHNLDENFTGSTSEYIKMFADWYSNLGGMVGVKGALAGKKGIIKNFNFDLDLGFSNTVFYDRGIYSPFSTKGIKYSDKSNFLGLKLPFRYSGNFDISITKPFSLSFSFPIYSDPYFNSDFFDRSETMDWISLLTSSNKEDETTSEISSYNWKISGSYSPTIADILKPYVSSFSISSSSTLNISSAQNVNINNDSRAKNSDSWISYSPERKFYYPTQLTPISANISLGGTLYEYPVKDYRTVKKVDFPVALNKPDSLKSQAEIKKEAEEKAAKEKAEQKKEKNDDKNTENKKESEEKIDLMPVLPKFDVTYESVTVPSDLIYSLTYTFNPNFVSQISYDTNSFTTPDDFDWTKIKSSMYSLRTPFTLNSRLSYAGNFISMDNKFSYEPIWQKHPDLSGYDENQKKSIELADYNAEAQTIINTNALSFRPFAYVPDFSETGITWNTTMKLFNRKFTGTAELPSWQNKPFDIKDSDSFTVHNLNIVLSAKELKDFKQTLSFVSTLAPQLPNFSLNLNLLFPFVSTSLSTGIQQKSKEDKTWKKNPLNQSLSFSYTKWNLSLSESFTYNMQDKNWDSLRFSLKWKDLSAVYSMSYITGYDFSEEVGWEPKQKKEFLPYTLSLNYNPSIQTFNLWSKNVTVTPGLSTSVVADLVRATNSYLLFSPSLTLKINDFLNITFSSTSRNSVLYRYFQTMLGHDGRIPGEQNIFLDLFNSFRFDDKNKRKESGFKLKSLNLDVTHQLHDWDFSMKLKFEPRLITKNGTSYYDYSPYFSLGIVWKPMASIKTQITDDYGTLKFN